MTYTSNSLARNFGQHIIIEHLDAASSSSRLPRSGFNIVLEEERCKGYSQCYFFRTLHLLVSLGNPNSADPIHRNA